MEQLFRQIAFDIALGLEVAGTLVITAGAIAALSGIVRLSIVSHAPLRGKKTVWLQFGVWLLLGLEFELAADIVRTAIAPTWSDIGQLAAIAVIRTFLNVFLERDLDKLNAAPSAGNPLPSASPLTRGGA